MCTYFLGSKTIDEDLYKMIQEKREPSENCQSAEEVAKFLQHVIEEKNPKLRYQTSKLANELVSQWITDPSGESYSEWMQAQTDALYGQWFSYER